MTQSSLDVLAAVALPGAAILGSKTSLAAARMVADVTGNPTPEWVSLLVGPFGSLVVLAIALKWVTSRMARSEAKADEREEASAQRIEAMHVKHEEKLETLTLAAMKVTDKVGRSLEAMVKALEKRPCSFQMDEQENLTDGFLSKDK